MLNIIYGKSGSGKTAYISSLIEKYVKESDKQAVYIVPEQFSFSSERKMLEVLGPVHCNKVEIVMSFTHIADSVFKLYGANNLPSLSNSAKSIIMSLALDGVSDHLEIYSNKYQYASFIKDLVSLSSELRQGAISEEILTAAEEKIEDELLKKKLSEIKLIFSLYESMIDGKFYDPDDKLTVLARTLDEFRFFEDKIVFIDGFVGFTEQEYKIIEKILLQSSQVYVGICTDSLFADKKDFSVFTPTQKTLGKLFSLAKKNNIPVSNGINVVSKHYKTDEIEFIQNEFLQSESSFERNCENIKILSAKNKIEECDYVACEVKRCLKQGFRARNIAVVSRNSEEYDSYMKSALMKCGVPVFFDKRSPVINQPLCAFIGFAVDIAVNAINSENIFGLLKTGVTGIDYEDISELENYCFMWNIKQKDWKNGFTQSPYGFGENFNDDVEIKLEKLNSLRRKIVAPLMKFVSKIKDGTDGKTFGESVYKLLCDFCAQENLKKIAIEFEENSESEMAILQERVWDSVMSILNDIANIVSDKKKSASQLATILNIAFLSEDLGNLPQGLDEIIVGDVLRTRMDEPEIVFVLGVNDNVFPIYNQSSSTFSEKEREILAGVGLDISNSLEDNYFEERLLGYKVFSCAKKKLYVSYSRNELNGKELSQSEFVDELERLFPGSEQIDLSKLDAEDFVESGETAYRMMAEKWRDNDEFSSAVKEAFKNREEYSSLLKALEKLSGEKNIRIENPENALKLFGKNMYVSPSKVELYYKCAFEYFCRYALKVNKLEKSIIDPRKRGSIVHYALEKLIKIYSIDALANMQESELRRAIKSILLTYSEECFGGLENKSKRFISQYTSFERNVFKLIKRLIDEFSNCEFVPVDFELNVDRNAEISPREIPISSGGVIMVRGQIDRVDSFKNDECNYIRIVDYKTGGKDFVLSDVFEGLNMQMLIYLFSIWDNGRERYGNVVPAGILYMPSKDSMVKAKKEMIGEEIEKLHNKQAKMKGAILNNTIVIEAMNEKYSPVSIGKTGNPTGDILSLKQFEKLKEKVDENLKNMAEELLKGNINPFPVYGKEYDKTCEYCDYKDICNIENDDKKREIEKLKFKDAKKLLGEEEEENG